MGSRQTEHMVCAIREECVEYSDCISKMTSVLFPVLITSRGRKQDHPHSPSLSISVLAVCRLTFNMQHTNLVPVSIPNSGSTSSTPKKQACQCGRYFTRSSQPSFDTAHQAVTKQKIKIVYSTKCD